MISMSSEGVASATLASASRPIRRAVTDVRARAVAERGNWASEPSSPTSAGRRQPRNRDHAARAVGGDRDFPFENQQRAVARLSLEHQDRLRFEGPEFRGFDQKRQIGFG